MALWTEGTSKAGKAPVKENSTHLRNCKYIRTGISSIHEEEAGEVKDLEAKP